MASSLACAPQGAGYPVVFPSRPVLALLGRLAALPKLAGVTAASRLEVRPAPAMVTSGVRALDGLTGGLPRGCLSEICGPASSGRTSLLVAVLAAATARQEVAALVDTSDAFDPQSAAAVGVDFERLLWVRCGKSNSPQRHPPASLRAGSDTEKYGNKNPKPPYMDALEQSLRVTDLLLQSGGFGLVAMDFGDVPFAAVRRISLTSWFRFQRAVENTPTVLLAITPAPCTQTGASLLLELRSSAKPVSCSALESPAHAQLFDGLQVEVELLRSRLARKPAQSAVFETRAARAG